MSAPNITRGWTSIGVNRAPVRDVTESAEDLGRERRFVIIWAHDYDAMVKELEELRETKSYLEAHMLILESVAQGKTEAKKKS